jgi:hypothetical protein
VLKYWGCNLRVLSEYCVLQEGRLCYFLFHRGVHKDGFLQPHDLAKYQVVLTTYETLRKELNYADLNTTDGHRYDKYYVTLVHFIIGGNEDVNDKLKLG